MVSIKAVVLVVLAAVLPGAVAATPLDDVMQTDRDFCAAAIKDGARAAFVAFAAPDAIMFAPGAGPLKRSEELV